MRIPEHWTQVRNQDAYRCTRCGHMVTGREVVSARKGVPIFRHVCEEEYLLINPDDGYTVRPAMNGGWMIYKSMLVSE